MVLGLELGIGIRVEDETVEGGCCSGCSCGCDCG